MERKIPDNFLLGAATSSFQIEGALQEDGRTPSIWDGFPAFRGDTGSQACEHYYRYRQDVEMMRLMGLEAYRFSLSWPRIHPRDDRTLNPKGMDFYDRLVDELLAAGITPWATLFHWDLPLWMHEKGGWENRDVVSYFESYVSDTVRVLGDRVKHWFTLNEPWCSTILGYETGEHAPGYKLEHKRVLNVVHNHLLAHGVAVRAARECYSDLSIGVVLNPWIPLPLTASEDDRLAAEIAWEEHVGWWFEPIYKERYPAKIAKVREADLPEVREGDMAVISTPCDFLGLNLYFPGFVRYKDTKQPYPYEECGDLVNLPRTEMGWQVYPPFISYALQRIHDLYSPGPLYITENGCAMDDRPDERGQVHDLWRQEYLRTHLDQLLMLRDNGVPIDGYFAWSLMDNFEWQYGYSKRFGLVHVDYESQQRTLKASALWYQACIADRVLRNR